MTFFWILVALAYVGALFWLAQRGDHSGSRANTLARHPVIYSLALGIYCTSWTYYGAIGEAAKSQWQYLPILLGPILLFIFGYPMLQKMLLVSKRQNITSVSDFISSRYGKRRSIAVLVTLLMTLATIPYIALQLKAVDASFAVFANLESGGGNNIKALGATLIMALFAVLFGTRHADITQYRSGLMLAIGAESLVKLFGLCFAGLFAYALLMSPDTDWQSVTAQAGLWSDWRGSSFDFVMQALMAAAAIFCLPRQFHVMIVDNHKTSHLAMARWLFPLYLVLTAIAIIPISMAGNILFAGSGVDQDTFLMQLPLSQGHHLLSLLVLIGGISAATAMIVVSGLALSTMLTNDVIVPLLLRNQPRRWLKDKNYKKRLLNIRRLVILLILLMAYSYFVIWADKSALSSMGLLAFSMVVQLTPAILGGLYWKQGHASGVIGGLALGLGCWVMFVMLPLAEQPGTQNSISIITQGVAISWIANLAGYLLFSLSAGHSLLERMQASAFVTPNADAGVNKRISAQSKISNGDLKELLNTFVGATRTDQLIHHYCKEQQTQLSDNATPSDDFIQFCERSLAGVLGGSSARSLIKVLISGQQMDVEEVFTFFEDTTEALKTNQAILFSSIENLSQGISVVDRDLKLVAWNKAYLDLFDYPAELVEIGQPIENLVRYNALHGECGPGEVEELVQKRLQHMQHGSQHRFIRRRSDGRVIEMNGNPLPTGGFVTSFNDITEHVEIQKALEEANIDLEKRIDHRTRQIREINQELKQAKLQAEQANRSKTRFLALASHDILQPLNAARLYLSAINEQELSEHNLQITHKLGASLNASEQLISTLLEIAKLEQGALTPTPSHFAVRDLIHSLEQEFRGMAEMNGVSLHIRQSNAIVHSDPTYLRRILQNLISNAIKYSPGGRVLVGCRKRSDHLRVEVWDNGLGISQAEQDEIFSDFYRAHRGQIKGVGLGLGVVKKMSEQLNHPITLRSEVGYGSCFSVRIPLGSKALDRHKQHQQGAQQRFEHTKVMCVDDNPTNLDALQSLLSKWGCDGDYLDKVGTALEYASQHNAPDLLIIDYQLDSENIDGLALITKLRSIWQQELPALLVTANKDEGLRNKAGQHRVNFLAKPIKPAALKAWIEHHQG
ncbi:PAS domain-containing hybrid sensor histidine kinase/response regulator [Lacimicrobium alkaliphilum]|uniref:PAS domain-containing hybrid sensor histidine kinase/response regulator n=1 Tax=Lacimicrobium alkaliphilum TaxID=1526571 RepID=UPI000BFF0956|nr:PAS-domain containing protein [Lacimicrobium alkaliphilum]